MRWEGQSIDAEQQEALPGLVKVQNLVRSVQTPEFAGITFHEVLAKTALNKVPGQSRMPFDWTINPYRGCSHACVYCLGADTLILMADGRQKPIWDVQVGDEVYGTERVGHYRRYVKTTVLARWNARKPAHRITLHDGTEIVASADHRFLTARGWKHVRGAERGPDARPHLTTNNSLVGFGTTGLHELDQPNFFSADYRRGYLTGMIRGDAHLGVHPYVRATGVPGEIHQFRLALIDQEALDISHDYLAMAGIETSHFAFSAATSARRALAGIRTAKRASVAKIKELIAWRTEEDIQWHRGFLAGIFDAEGSHSRGILRISNNDPEILDQIRQSLDELGVPHSTDGPATNGVYAIRVTGGLQMRQRFFRLVSPAITRKLSLDGFALKSNAKLGVERIDDLRRAEHMVDITTGTGDFIANGVVSHNCFARSTHTYLDLDSGKDFDSQIIVKVNVAEVLERELAKRSWGRQPVALGTNTDPYQRAEGRYRLMPGIIEALAASGTPLSILTKGTLLRRDLPLLVKASERVPVHLSMSIAVYDDELQQSVEPGTPTTAARLATVRAASAAGIPVTVFLMPILPYLTDTRAHLDDALGRVADAGASSVVHSALHLRPGVKEWFMQWLAAHDPGLVACYAAMYGRSAYAPADYRKWLAAKVRPLVRAHGLRYGTEERSGPHTAVDGETSAAANPAVPPTLF